MCKKVDELYFLLISCLVSSFAPPTQAVHPTSTQSTAQQSHFCTFIHALLVIHEACDTSHAIGEAAVSHQHAHKTWHLNKDKLEVLCPVGQPALGMAHFNLTLVRCHVLCAC